MSYSSFSQWRGHGINPHIWVLGDRAKKMSPSENIHLWIPEISMPLLSIFYSVQQTVWVTVMEDDIGLGWEEWKAGVGNDKVMVPCLLEGPYFLLLWFSSSFSLPHLIYSSVFLSTPYSASPLLWSCWGTHRQCLAWLVALRSKVLLTTLNLILWSQSILRSVPPPHPLATCSFPSPHQCLRTFGDLHRL